MIESKSYDLVVKTANLTIPDLLKILGFDDLDSDGTTVKLFAAGQQFLSVLPGNDVTITIQAEQRRLVSMKLSLDEVTDEKDGT
jgi:hypothetical protein